MGKVDVEVKSMPVAKGNPITLDCATVERVAVALAKAHGTDFREVCPYEGDEPGDYCESDTCVAAGFEDHDADVARDYYRSLARAAVRELLGL